MLNLNPGQTYELANGVRVKVVRKTGSGRFTVQAAEDRGSYFVGQTFQVNPEDLREKQDRLEEIVARYEEAKEHTLWELNHNVKRAVGTRQKVADAILNGGFESLTNEFRWGNGVKEDIIGSISERILASINEHGLEQSLAWIVEELRQSLLRNSYAPTSTSMFRNAVEVVRAEVARDMVDSLDRDLQRLRRLAGEIVYASL